MVSRTKRSEAPMGRWQLLNFFELRVEELGRSLGGNSPPKPLVMSKLKSLFHLPELLLPRTLIDQR